ncbi:putative poly(glycerol-phosphate) alpha-glucosyltransferase [compost metagenome]
MRLLYLLHKIDVGGVTTVLINKLNYLVNTFNYEILIMVETSINNDLASQFDEKIVIKTFNQNVYQNLPDIPLVQEYIINKRLRKELLVILNSYKPNIICDVGWGYNTIVVPSLNNVIKVREYHESYRSQKYVKSYKGLNLYDRLRSAYSRSLEKHYTRTVSLTAKDASHRDYLNIKPFVIANPLAKITNPNNWDRKKIVLGVGVLNKRKNFIEMLQIWAKLSSDFPSWELHIYGKDHGEYENLQSYILSHNLQDVVYLKGHTYSITEKLQESSALFCTSLSEGLPMMLLEGQQMGLPIISYDCDCGPSDIINDCSDGFLVPLQNQEIFIDKAKILLSDEQMRLRMGEKAIINARLFSIEKIAEKWDEFYKNLVK